MQEDLGRWQKRKGKLDVALSTSPVGPLLSSELIAGMGFVIDARNVNGMFGGPGDKFYKNRQIAKDFAAAVLTGGESQQDPAAADSLTYVSAGTQVRWRPAANCVRNAPDWEWLRGVRRAAGWKDGQQKRIKFIRENIFTGSTADAN